MLEQDNQLFSYTSISAPLSVNLWYIMHYMLVLSDILLTKASF